MSWVKTLRKRGVEFWDPKIWDLLEDLENMPEDLAREDREAKEYDEFVDSVFAEAVRIAGIKPMI